MLRDTIKKILNEATGDGDRGSYIAPLQPGERPFKKIDLQPFTIKVSKYDSPMLEFDSFDGKMDETPKQIKKIESKAEKITNKIKKNPYLTFSDDDGNNINQTPGKGKKIVPIKEDTLSEDLGVWFGTKKKPKGSKQPKGPWVNICKKVGGKHPPCGRPEATDKAYPKCRAAGVAGKMSDSQKRAACAQKRRAEKTHNKTGTGNSPKMTSYKTKSQNESLRILIKRILSEQTIPKVGDKIDLQCMDPYKTGVGTTVNNLEYSKYISQNENLYLKKTSVVRDTPYDDNNEVRIVLEKVTDDELKKVFNITDNNTKLMTYYPSLSQKYYCTIKKTPSSDWQNFFNEHNIKTTV